MMPNFGLWSDHRLHRILGYRGVHKQLLAGIDARRAHIQAELDEARRLKDEARR